ncbi:hypothetical protein [Planococcus salinarum]|uniref:hypothetical protein n=1 Tax=Planococcus salinarum TaxID=622695 RepID=UPI000E3D415F|nr:hypothetical protein [Planococcus salinarum]TAA68344.1 hypothetical protein D2909_14085 [Planococcus salinarum]
MEPLIFALIIMAIGAFFNNKKKDEGGSRPNRNAGGQQRTSGRAQGGFKRMEDYAKEMYGEFQAQMNPEADKREQVKEQVKEKTKEVVGRQSQSRPGREAKSFADYEIGGRMSSRKTPSRPPLEKTAEESRSPFPLSQSEAQRAIVLAEVFMPPKAKRK